MNKNIIALINISFYINMVVCSSEHGLQADVLFIVEATAVNGAYLNDIKSHYIIPALE